MLHVAKYKSSFINKKKAHKYNDFAQLHKFCTYHHLNSKSYLFEPDLQGPTQVLGILF